MQELILGAASGVGMNLVANFLTDAAYKAYHKARQLKRVNKNERQQLQGNLEDFTSSYSGLIADSSAFLNFLQEPQISDVLHDYLYYMAVGSGTKLSRREIIEYLTDGALNYCRRYPGVISTSRVDISEFFTHFFINMEEYYYSKLNQSQISMLCMISNQLDLLESNIKSCIQERLVLNIPGFDEVFDQYTKILRNNNQMSFVYGYSEFRLDSIYVTPRLIKMSDENKEMLVSLRNKKNYLDWKNIFSDNHIVYLIGGPGFGKSLFLKNVINHTDLLNIPDSKRHLVIICDLKAYCRDDFANNYSILDFLRNGMMESTGMGSEEISAEFVNYYLKTGRCIILLDALDEVPKKHREKVHTLITGFFSTYNPYNKICITSRSRGFLPKQNIEVYKIEPIDENDIRNYLDRMIKLKYFKKEDMENFMLQATPLIHKEFLNSFLTLSLLIKIFRSEKELPMTKVELYSKCFDYIAIKREEEKNSYYGKFNWNIIDKFMTDSTFIDIAQLSIPNNRNIPDAEIIDQLLPVYTTKFGTEYIAETAIREFLFFCGERTELLVPAAEEKTYRFFHRSFFEYFYSKYIARISEPAKIWQLLRQFDLDSEVFELVIALIKKEDARKYQTLVQYLFNIVERSFHNKRVKAFPLHALSNMIPVIDDKIYRTQFVQLFLTYSDIIISKNMFDQLNFSSCFIINKMLETDSDLLSEFSEKYTMAAIDNLLYDVSFASYHPGVNTAKDCISYIFQKGALGNSIELSIALESITQTRAFRLKLKEELLNNLHVYAFLLFKEEQSSFQEELWALTEEDWKELVRD